MKRIISRLLPILMVLCMTLPLLTETGCSAIKDFVIKDSVLIEYNGSGGDVTIPDSVASIGYEAFHNCDSLIGVTIPASVTVIEMGAFAGCVNLTSIDVAEENPAYCSVDGVLFDAGQTLLHTYPADKSGSYSIPATVSNIADSAFSGCNGLIGVTIPGSVTNIGERAFYDCNGLADVYYDGSEDQWSEIKIGSFNDPLLNATVHCTVTDSDPMDADVQQESEPEDVQEFTPEIAQMYFDILRKYEAGILKQDHVPFSDTVTGTVAFLDITGDNVSELLFISVESSGGQYGVEQKFLNIYSSESAEEKLLYQGQVNFNAVGSQREYEIYKFEDAYDLYTYTDFSEGSEGTTTNKKLTMQDGQINEHILEEVYHYTDDTIEYFYDAASISQTDYMAYLNEWTSKPKVAVILNIADADAISITYAEALDYLKTQGAVSPMESADNGSVDPLTLYAPILEKYRAVVNREKEWDPDDFLGDPALFGFVGNYGYGKAGYAFIDIDQNGIPELFIGSTTAADEGEWGIGLIYALYTYCNDSTVIVTQSMERDRYYLLENGMIRNDWSGGASNSGVDYYVLEKDSVTLTPAQSSSSPAKFIELTSF